MLTAHPAGYDAVVSQPTRPPHLVGGTAGDGPRVLGGDDRLAKLRRGSSVDGGLFAAGAAGRLTLGRVGQKPASRAGRSAPGLRADECATGWHTHTGIEATDIAPRSRMIATDSAGTILDAHRMVRSSALDKG